MNNNEQPSGNAWTRFWFTAIPTTGIQSLRVLSGLLFTFWLLSFLGHQEGFFSLRGFFDSEGYRAIQAQRQQDALGAPMGWSALYLAGENMLLFHLIYWASVFVILCFTLGIATRITGVFTWIAVVSFLANPATSFEGDFLLGILAFHLMVGHLLLGLWNGNLSVPEYILGSKDDFLFARWFFPQGNESRSLSYAANFMMRMLQIHVAVILVTSGMHKLQMGDWWSGIAFWYPFHPPLQTTAETVTRGRSSATTLLFFLSLAQYATLAWQVGFPAFAWRTGTFARIVLLGGATIGWLGTAFLYKLPLFGPFVFLGCLSFLTTDEWSRLVGRFTGLMNRNTRTREHKIVTTSSTAITANVGAPK